MDTYTLNQGLDQVRFGNTTGLGETGGKGKTDILQNLIVIGHIYRIPCYSRECSPNVVYRIDLHIKSIQIIPFILTKKDVSDEEQCCSKYWLMLDSLEGFTYPSSSIIHSHNRITNIVLAYSHLFQGIDLSILLASHQKYTPN